MSAPVLRLEGVAVRFGGAPGLEPLSLDVAAGERLALVGSSGAGKTTLLRAVAGLAPVAAGRVLIAGRDCAGLPPEGRDAVYLHQTPLLFPHLSVFENVAFPLRVRRVAEAEVRRRAARALADVQMEGMGGRRPQTLSGGQRHRVALARAIVARPALLLLDEPLSALDPALREEVRAAILAVQQEYRPALVLVTHDLDEAGMLADRVGVLLDRGLAQVAPPGELFDRPASLAVARFLGIPNEVPGRVLPDGRFQSALGTLAVPGPPLPPGPAVAVCRPEALRSAAEGGVPARVVGLRHRVHRTTARARLEGSAVEVELPVDPAAPPRPGDPLALLVDPAALRLFSS